MVTRDGRDRNRVVCGRMQVQSRLYDTGIRGDNMGNDDITHEGYKGGVLSRL